MIRKIWQYDFQSLPGNHPRHFHALSSLTVVFVLTSVIFSFYDLLADNASAFTNLVREQGIVLERLVFNRNDPFHWFLVSIAAFFIFYSFFISLYDLLSIRREGKMKKFLPVFLAHLSSSLLLLFVIDALLGLAQSPLKQLLASSGLLSEQAKAGLEQHTFLIDQAIAALENFVNSKVPTLLYAPPFIAFLLGLLTAGFFEYGVHWLDHKSRFLWLVNHRIHHTAEHMHPMGVGVVDVFPKLFVGIPKIILYAAASKLYHHNALFGYSLAYTVLYIFTQYFNHSTTYYNIFNKRPWLSMLLFLPHSNGTIHYVHHSALKGDEAVNLSAGGFCFWDFVFGTFRMPYAERPPVGLTHTPPIRLNPLSLLFSGWQQLFYEWRHNPDWKVRWKILFGDIWYMPPVTKDFLKLTGKDPENLSSVP